MRSLDNIKIQRYSIHRLIITLSLLFFLVISINSVSLEINNTYKNDYASRMEINIANNYVDQQKLIKSKDIEDLSIDFPNGSISYMNESEGIVEANHFIFPIKIVSSSENLAKFLGLDILRGCFFNSEQYQYGNKVAVISDNLAYKLFTSHNVIGNEILISGVKYKIIGLYKSERSSLSELASDGIERVYIPFNSVTSEGSQALNTLFIKDDTLKEKSFRVHYVEETLKKTLGIEPNTYRINDFYDSSIYISQPLLLFIFFIGVLLIIMLIKYFLKYLKLGYSNLKSGLKSNYFLQLLFKWKFRILLYLIGVGLVIFIIIKTFGTIKFKVTIPTEYIPVDNIFDFNFYANKLKDAIYKLNSNVGYIPTQMEIFLRYSLLVIYISILLLLINFIAVLSSIKLNKLSSESATNQMSVFVALALSILLGSALSFIFSLICGVKYIIPVKEMLILIAFLSIKLIDEKKIDKFSSQILFKTTQKVH